MHFKEQSQDQVDHSHDQVASPTAVDTPMPTSQLLNLEAALQEDEHPVPVQQVTKQEELPRLSGLMAVQMRRKTVQMQQEPVLEPLTSKAVSEKYYDEESNSESSYHEEVQPPHE